MYPKVRDALVAGEKVTIKYSNINLNEIIEEVVSQGINNKSGPTYMNPADVQEKLQEISGEIQVLTAMLKGRLIN
jgi:tagatose-1,6-bisphosphate aldolase non-catalytic subunit AgaZ/GatZ